MSCDTGNVKVQGLSCISLHQQNLFLYLSEQAQFRKEKGQVILREHQVTTYIGNLLCEAGWYSQRVLREMADVIFEAVYLYIKIRVVQ